jgi:hypothetical protein
LGGCEVKGGRNWNLKETNVLLDIQNNQDKETIERYHRKVEEMVEMKKDVEEKEKRCREEFESYIKEKNKEIEMLKERNLWLCEKVSFNYGQFIHNKTINLTKSVIKSCYYIIISLLYHLRWQLLRSYA